MTATEPTVQPDGVDRPSAGEPRTEAGRALMDLWIADTEVPQLDWKRMREGIVAVEQQAAARPPSLSELAEAINAALYDTPHWSYRFDRLQLAQILASKVARKLGGAEQSEGA